MTVVVKVSGHLVSPRPGEVDPVYVSELVEVLREVQRAEGRVAVVVGGGLTARGYVRSCRRMGLSEGALDVIGIAIARVNAMAVAAKYFNSHPPTPPSTLGEAVERVLTAGIAFLGGLQPGQSTTTVAALLAESLSARLLVLATDVDGIYDSDPRTNPNAKLLEEVTVSQLERMFSELSGAGGYALLDPYTLKIIKRSRLNAVVINGQPPSNILAAVKGEKLGTRIKV